jgi:carbonic anhydrase
MRKFLKIFVPLIVFTFVAGLYASGEEAEKGLSPDKAVEKLVKGNKRYYTGKMTHKNQGKKRRAETADGQQPFAVIVTCSDSRVAPEVVFDQGLGDIFVVRTAGNVIDDVAIGSIEYAVEHLGARLILVMGHKRCGAVKAVVDGAKVEGHLKAIVKKIKPAVNQAKKDKFELLDNSVRKNVLNVVKELEKSGPVLKKMTASKEVYIMPAYYDLDTGKVSPVSDKPVQPKKKGPIQYK